MKFARFEFKRDVSIGAVKDEEITLLEGSLFKGFTETKRRIPLSKVKLLPPTNPSKIVCVGLNYRDHIKEIGAEVPENPIFFLKPPSSLIGHDEPIIFPAIAESISYEGELAVVIKEKMREVPESRVLQHVLGFTCFNDVTERSFIAKSPLLLTASKGFDTFAPVGPYIATNLDPNNINIKTYLNGNLMQDDNTQNCVFSIEQILHYVSRCMTLYPGDIVATGTPKGVAAIKPGDIIEVEIEGIGRLRNRVEH
jgi:2-keto-4-pentenoate hydratase/2-oxohepta-3-ene-1,7-dioic acid hydratase in catechol pathway